MTRYIILNQYLLDGVSKLHDVNIILSEILNLERFLSGSPTASVQMLCPVKKIKYIYIAWNKCHHIQTTSFPPHNLSQNKSAWLPRSAQKEPHAPFFCFVFHLSPLCFGQLHPTLYWAISESQAGFPSQCAYLLSYFILHSEMESFQLQRRSTGWENVS